MEWLQDAAEVCMLYENITSEAAISTEHANIHITI